MTQATALAALALPCVLLAHLLTAGAVVTLPAAASCALVVFGVTAAVPARSALSLSLLTGAAQLAAHTLLAVLPAAGTSGSTGATGCIPIVGRGAELGLRLAVFRADAACPGGSVMAGATTTAALAALFSAVMILTAHAAFAALTGWLLADSAAALLVLTAAGLIGGLIGLIATVGRLLDRVPAVPSWLRVLPPTPAPDRVAMRPLPQGSPALRRGPPAARCSFA